MLIVSGKRSSLLRGGKVEVTKGGLPIPPISSKSMSSIANPGRLIDLGRKLVLRPMGLVVLVRPLLCITFNNLHRESDHRFEVYAFVLEIHRPFHHLATAETSASWFA